ncbi:MAG: glycosyltransferase [Candidatus Marsarchaeota archaeon]|nr:glycosyltransferase [Candidatus Marsarchaeota archaeon]
MVFFINKEIGVRLLSVAIFIVLTSVGLVFSSWFIYSAGSTYMFLLALCFMALTLVSGFFNIFTSYSYYRSYFYTDYINKISSRLKPLLKFPTVAIAVPVYNEDPKFVKKNMLRLKDLEYPKDKIVYYLLDDSTDKSIRSELEKFSALNGIRYIHRNNRKGFKAGALNNMLKNSKEEFIAIFDYDEYITNTKFLMDLLPYFQDKKLSYLQTEKRYFKNSFFSDTIDLFDAFFFKFIQPARALNNTAIFAGSCGILRKSYLQKIGGFPEYIIEDTFFSFESDMHGYKSLFIPKVYAHGKPINRFTELVKQQWRYNYGDTQFVGYFFKRSKNNRKNLSPLSRIDYMTHGFGLNYISIVLLLFTMLSILIVFGQLSGQVFSVKNILNSSNIGFDLEILGISAFALSIVAPAILTKMYFKSLRKGLMIFLLNFSLAFIRTKAAVAAVLNMKGKTMWSGRKMNINDRQFTYSLKNSMMEVSFSIVLFAFSAIAMGIDNMYGAMWLLWYGILYISTFFLFYKYG